MKQIQWFPGHMAKARRLVEEKLGLVDIVFELLDARIPVSSQNPMLEEIIKDKPRLVLLNKADLADPREVDKWVSYYKNKGIDALATNSLTGNPLDDVLKKCEHILLKLREKEKSRGMTSRPLRAIIIGIPNVGKSQFINRLAGKNKAKTGDKPGVTKMQLYIRAGKDLELLDNPGILWPKFDSKTVAFHLALVGSIKDDTLPTDEVVLFGLKFLAKNYPSELMKRYDLESVQTDDYIKLLDDIGIKRGCILKGNSIDYERVMKLFLYDFRNQAFGKLSLERVIDYV